MEKEKKKDRPICEVLEEIKKIVAQEELLYVFSNPDKRKILSLVEEALSYAKRMQARLQQNKKDILLLAAGKPPSYGEGEVE
jgi:hypothetical protein